MPPENLPIGPGSAQPPQRQTPPSSPQPSMPSAPERPTPPPFAPQPSAQPGTPQRYGGGGGMDQQTKNIILFAIIFSVLAVAIATFFIIKTQRKPAGTVRTATTTIATGTLSTVTKSPFSSIFDIQFFNFGTNPNSRASNMFTEPPRSTSTARQTATSSTTTTRPPAQRPTTVDPRKTPYVSTTTETDPRQAPLSAEEQQRAYLRNLEGIYGETKATEDQLERINLTLMSSPLRGKLWISSVRRSTVSGQEYVVLSTKNTLPKETVITGMTLKSLASGNTIQIGEGVGFPQQNQVNDPEGIIVRPGQRVYLVSGRSPLGYSFRINKCTGYFEQFQNFTPALPRTCPILKNEPRPEPPNHLSDACLDYVDRHPQCTVYTKPITALDERQYDCLVFVQNHTGYQNCVNLHKDDSNFWGNEWRVYLNWDTPIWKQKREIIWLLDQSGRFISQYSY